MNTPVKLPAGTLIDEWCLCKAIAQAIQPADEKAFKGIDCIEGKLVTVHVPLSNSMRCNEAGSAAVRWRNRHLCTGAALGPSPQVPPTEFDASMQAEPVAGNEDQTMESFTLPYGLTDDDRRMLEKLLPDLPPLRYPVSLVEWANFIAAYFKLPNRPAWEPVLITAKRIGEYKARHEHVMDDHRVRLQEEVRLGNVVAVNPTSRVPVLKLSFGDTIPREQAIAYLKRCGIAHDGEANEVHQNAEIQEVDLHPAPQNVKKKAIGTVYLSPKQKKEAVEMYYKLKEKRVKKHTFLVAEHYEVTTRTIQNIVAEDKEYKNRFKMA